MISRKTLSRLAEMELGDLAEALGSGEYVLSKRQKAHLFDVMMGTECPEDEHLEEKEEVISLLQAPIKVSTLEGHFCGGYESAHWSSKPEWCAKCVEACVKLLETYVVLSLLSVMYLLCLYCLLCLFTLAQGLKKTLCTCSKSESFVLRQRSSSRVE